jgi:hypothetical protein
VDLRIHRPPPVDPGSNGGRSFVRFKKHSRLGLLFFPPESARSTFCRELIYGCSEPADQILSISNQTLVGNGGFNHVDNLYFYNGEFILVGDATDFQIELFAGEREGSSDAYSVVVRSEQEAQQLFKGRPVIWVPETTLLFFEYLEKTTCLFMDHYYHFMEYLEGIYYVYAAHGAGHVSMVLFPDCKNHQWVGKEPQMLNQLVLQALFPTTIQAGPLFLDSFPNQVLHFKRIVSGDRAGSHQTQRVGRVSRSHTINLRYLL